ncbi:MAG: radical SAM protein, partial [Bacillota bacterium]
MAFLDCQDGRRPVVMPERTSRHPCFSATACLQYARMHLPVAPRCNIACNYCNRKYDCAHESRPGVTSGVLSPAGALERFLLLRGRLENLSVVGIAGPGDALANWESTRQTIELIKMHAPELIFCLSTNGLLLPDYAASLTGLGVDHVTVTVNCLDPAIGEKIYRYVHYRGKRYTGREGAALLIANQLAGIAELSGRGVVVKVNIVLIKGINEGHIPEVVRKMRDLGAYI